MAVWQIQSNLNRGEIDPIAIGRTDLDAYYNGVRLATNVLPIPQGGMKKRAGQKFLGIALGDGRLENFSFNVEQNYLLVFTDLKMQIYKDDILQLNINGSGNDFVATPWTLAQIADFDYIQSADTAIVTHPNVDPTTISRTSDTDWDITTIVFTNQIQLDYDDASSPTPVSEIQDLLFTNRAEGDRYKLALEGILSEELVFAGDDSTNQDNIQKALQDLPNTGLTGITVTGTTPTYTVTFAGNSAFPFELITGTAIFTANVLFNVASTRTQTGTSRGEDVWSSTRGFPVSCTFHEARLYFGGSLSRPATLWGSRVNDFFNFDPGKGREDESIDVTLDTDQVNAIENIFSNRSLQIFTSGAEFFVRESPITPANIAVIPQTNLGSKRVRPVTIDGVTLFIQKTGKSVNQFVFLEQVQSNQTRSISTLASHLIINPIQLSVSRGTESTDANYVYILNDNGDLTVFNTLIAEDVQGFSTWITTGDINSVAVVDNSAHFLVERTIGGGQVFYIEKEDTDLNTDSGVITNVGGSDTLTGLDHLNGETVEVKADGAVQLDEIVSGGQITIGRDATIIEAGLKFRPIIQTMPEALNLQNGSNVFKKKKIQRVGINMFESNGVIVNDQLIPDKTIGLNQFDAPAPQTGEFRVYLLGYKLDNSITITQDTPMNMTILNIGLEIAT